MVCLKVCDSIKSICLILLAILATTEVGAQCKADYSYAIDFNTGFVSFTNQSVPANSNLAVQYTWYINPVNVLSNDTNPVIRLKPGLQTVCLIINNAGCSDTFCQSISMPPVHCRSRFSYTFDFTMDTTFFTNGSSGLNLNYYWSFGDGSYSRELNPQHRFTVNGWYYVCLNVVNTDTTCSDVTCEFVRINRSSPSPCKGNFSFETDTTDSHSVIFTNMTVGDTGITYVWLFGDTATSSDKNPIHRFDSVGTYKVCLLVSGPNCADSVCKQLEIITIIPQCKAEFAYTLFPDSGNNAPRIGLFTNKSTGTNLTYKWIFNGTDSSTEVSPIHYFKVNGTYSVCLVVQSGTLCTDSICKNITIQTGLGNVRRRSGLTIYPNPAEDFVLVDILNSDNAGISVSMRDVLGNIKPVNTTFQHSSIILDIRSFEKGLYTIEVNTKEGRETFKMIK
jgi:PKD repeat protein